MCVSQLLAHLLFLTANGGSSQGSTSTSSSSAGGTALADTFTTPYFVRCVCRVACLPCGLLCDCAGGRP